MRMEYKVLLLAEGFDGLKPEQLRDSINGLRNQNSVISSDSEIEVLTECNNDAEIDVFVGKGDRSKEARHRAQEAKKPALLCDIDCSQVESYDATTVSYTWGLFGKNYKEKERAFLKHYNLSFVYDAGTQNLMGYVAPLVFHQLEEFSYHSKYNTNFGYKKQAEFVHEFTQFYLDKMKQLVDAEHFVRDDIEGDFYHIIYRYRPDNANQPFKSIDGRDYDFVIEYHRGKPSEGIYYGVKGEVQEEDKLNNQCEIFRKEWPCIFMKEHKDREGCLTDLQKATTDILNDTFLWKDFLRCFKPTDNFNKKRYWLFWITLNDDEDIISVARLAVKLMSRTFNKYLWDKDNATYVDREKKIEEKKERGRPKQMDKRNDNYLRIPYFSDEAYNKLCGLYNEGTIDGWITKLVEKKIIERDEMYERCYRLKPIDIGWNDFIDKYVKTSNNEQNISSPFTTEAEEKAVYLKKKVKVVYHYELLVRLFLPTDGIRIMGNDRPK